MWFWLGGSNKGALADDSKELLAQLRIVTNRPATDRDLTDQQGYLFLTNAQTQLTYRLASHIPDLMRGLPEKMTTGDGGASYSTKADALGHMEVYPAPFMEPLVAGPYWDQRADYVAEGPRSIRLLHPMTFVDGAPYARYMPKPGVIDDTSQPTLVPADVRRVLPWLAAAMWARAGGRHDPQPYLDEVERQLWGDPASPGDVGLIPAYKLQHFSSGLSATTMGGAGLWWRSPDLLGPR